LYLRKKLEKKFPTPCDGRELGRFSISWLFEDSMMKWTYAIVSALILPAVAGCGTNLNEALLLASESGARTLVDVLLSDLYADLPDLFTIPPVVGETTDDADDGNDGGDVGPGDGAVTDGDAETGGQVFTANSCAACHCADASGGCAASAPAVVGADVDTLRNRLQGDTPHTGGKFADLSAQDLADVEAFLADLGG
jgi:mono/diheme cytochrome c family protein